jgi:hypothetical protein
VLTSALEKTGWVDGMALRFEERYYRLVHVQAPAPGAARWTYRFRAWPEGEIFRRLVDYEQDLATDYAGALWASERWFARENPVLATRLRETRRDVEREFGWKAVLAARVVGSVAFATLWREDRRLRRGVTYEPPTFYEANPAAAVRPEVAGRGAAACRWVEPPVTPTEATEAVA